MIAADQGDVITIGRTLGRQPFRTFGIKQSDRFSHLLLLGRTGTGKSTLMANMMMQDIAAGRGVCLLDPHGDLVEQIYAQIPPHRIDDVFYIDVPNAPNVYGYNPLRYVRSDKRSLAASGVLQVFKKLWADSWGVRMEHILRNCILTLLEAPDANLSDILRLLTDKDFRERVLARVENQQVRYFWKKEYEKYSPPFRLNAIAPIQNKVGAFLTDPRLHGMLVKPQNDLSFRQLMDDNKIVLVNLSKGQIGEDASNLIGALLATTMALAAFSRQDIPMGQRQDFMLYMDEFQNFTTSILADMAAELRKYKTGLVCATQILDTMDADLKFSLLGNLGSLISFRLGARDASYVAREFAPTFNASDLISQPNHQFAARLMIDGNPTRAFSGKTFLLKRGMAIN